MHHCTCSPSRLLSRACALVCGLLAIALCAAIGPARAQEVTLKVHHFVPPGGNLHAKFLVPWAEKVTQDSGGKIKFQLYPAMQLGGSAPQLIDQVKDGVVDIVWAVPGFTAGRFPAFEAFELPFMTKTAQGSSRALWEYVHANNIAATEFKDVRLLAAHVHDAGFFHMVKRPVQTMADLRGQKIRAGTRVITKFMGALGASPVGMPLPQLPDALAKGVVDGTLLPWEIVPSIKVHELVKYHSETDPAARALYTTCFVFAMNPAKYASLAPELRRVIDANSGVELSAQLGKLWDDWAAPARKLAQAHGNQLNTISASELKSWESAGEVVVADWKKEVAARGFDGDALLKSAKDLIAKYDTK